MCLFSPSLHLTPAEPTSLPHLHPPSWFCPCVLYSSSCNSLSSLSPPHSSLTIVRLFLTSMSLVIFCFLFSSVDYVPVKGESLFEFLIKQASCPYSIKTPGVNVLCKFIERSSLLKHLAIMETCICVWVWEFTCLHNGIMNMKFTTVLTSGERLLSDWTNSTLVVKQMLLQLMWVLSQPSLPTSPPLHLPHPGVFKVQELRVAHFSIAGVSEVSSRSLASLSSLCALFSCC